MINNEILNWKWKCRRGSPLMSDLTLIFTVASSFRFFYILTRRHLHILQMLRSDGVSGALTFNVKLSARMQMSVHKVSARRSDQTSRRFWNNTAAACGIDTGPDASLPSALCD